jgi:hypothetical protein
MDTLTQQWKYAKEQESLWNQKRIEIESAIYEANRASIPEKGTFTAEDGMKITTGFTEEWDQAAVTQAHQKWPSDLRFPFAGVWKPDGKAISYLRDNAPAAYALLQPALTLKPKKPAFSVKEKGDA